MVNLKMNVLIFTKVRKTNVYIMRESRTRKLTSTPRCLPLSVFVGSRLQLVKHEVNMMIFPLELDRIKDSTI